MKLKNILFIGILGLVSERALANEVVCKISDASKQKSNEAPSVLGTVTQTKPSPGNKNKTVTTTTNLVTQTPPERCQQKMGCLVVKDRPRNYVLCDATYTVNVQVYTGQVLIGLEEAATRQNLVEATAPSEGFTSLTMRNKTPDVFVQCDLATETNRECK